MSDGLSGLSMVRELLAYLIKTINQPIKTWFDVDRLNRGGRPTKNRRRGTSSSFDSRRPPQPSSAEDPQQRRVAASFGFARPSSPPADLDDRGIERAVEKAIKELSKEQRKGFKRIPKPPATPTESGSANS